MSLYGEYIKERLGDEIIEKLEGFATYRFLERDNISCVYIVDIYVRHDFRKVALASTMADEIVEKAKAKGCKRLLGTVNPSAKGATESLKILLAYGMSLHSCSNDLIIFKKEL